MKVLGPLAVLSLGVGLGALAVGTSLRDAKPLAASSNDRYGDYILCTGPVAVNPRAPTDGVWLLDYRGGKLLGTVIDRGAGKIMGWAEVDLVSEFGIPPRQDVHFLMSCGNVAQGQSALYIAEVTTGKFGVYSMGPNPGGPGVVIRRHDVVSFRGGQPAPQQGNIQPVGGVAPRN